MTPGEHYAEAERLIAKVVAGAGTEDVTNAILLAQVHATLATVAVVGYSE